MGYIITIILMCLLYGVSIYLMKYLKSERAVKIINVLLPVLVFVPYVALCIKVYGDVGFYDWNFQNTLPVANVSPFMFSLMPLMLILRGKGREYLGLLISLLTVGMFLSTVFSCAYNASINYKFHFHFLLDYFAHFALSLYGVYLIRSRQVKLSLKNCLVSSSLIVGAAAVMLILNLCFDTAFFGLSLNGKHNIYNMVIVDNSYISALLYFMGLIFVLLAGYLVCCLLNKEKATMKENLTEK